MLVIRDGDQQLQSDEGGASNNLTGSDRDKMLEEDPAGEEDISPSPQGFSPDMQDDDDDDEDEEENPEALE